MIYTARLTEIARRKERIVASIGREREMISAEFRAWQKPLEVLDRGIAATRFLRAHPVLVAAAIALAAILGRHSLLRWAGRGLVVWRSWRALQTWVRALNV